MRREGALPLSPGGGGTAAIPKGIKRLCNPNVMRSLMLMMDNADATIALYRSSVIDSVHKP